MVASAVLVLVVTITSVAFVHVLRTQQQVMIQTELDADLQVAMERVKNSFRLTARDKMLYYPPGTGITHTAVSFPMLTNNSMTGVVDLDTNNNVVWGQTVIYHAWTAPYSNQFRVTTFAPRNQARTDVERQTQLAQVVKYGDGRNANVMDNTNGSTQIIFDNVFEWRINEVGGDYDGYAAKTQWARGVKLGSIVLGPGDHTFLFTVFSNNPSCTGAKCRIGIDSLYASPSGSRREAEAQRVTASSVGMQTNYMPYGSWYGNYQLYFPGTATGQSFAVVMANDKWEDTNFRGTGENCDNGHTDVSWDNTLSPMDYVVELSGKGASWQGYQQAGDSVGFSSNGLNGAGVRVLLRGGDSSVDNWIANDGEMCRVWFRSGAGQVLTVWNATIARAVADSCDLVPGTSVPLTSDDWPFFTVPTSASVGGTLATDWVHVPGGIQKTNSYVVSFMVWDNISYDRAWAWRESKYPAAVGSYIIRDATPVQMAAEHWDSTQYVADASMVAVSALEVSYPTNGYYTSEIFDTTVSTNPVNYNQMSWAVVASNGSAVAMQVRTGNSNDLSDAAAWGTTWQTSSPYTMGTGGRYVQWKARLTPSSDYMVSPKIKWVYIGWEGETKAVDITGDFTKGPDYGVFNCTVDGRLLRKAIGVTMTLYENSPTTGGGTKTLTSTLTQEVEPRNTGK
jgi:hypothetical protein